MSSPYVIAQAVEDRLHAHHWNWCKRRFSRTGIKVQHNAAIVSLEGIFESIYIEVNVGLARFQSQSWRYSR